MKATIFDGRKFATEKEAALLSRVFGLKTRGVHPKLASIIVGNDPASELYVNLKKKAAERIGAEVDIYDIPTRKVEDDLSTFDERRHKIPKNSKLEEILFLIKTLNEDETVHGIMIQMPLPSSMENSKSEILNSIAPEKDVDGLKENSSFLHPTSKAVMQVIGEAQKELDATCKKRTCKVVVVGATGMVGVPLVKELKLQSYKVIECNTKTEDLEKKTAQADVLISVTGTPNIISGDMVKKGAIVIDVGSPKGDVDFDSASQKASFITPVPGGVGPVTITCLLENLISAC